jgi:diguanylate cyclase
VSAPRGRSLDRRVFFLAALLAGAGFGVFTVWLALGIGGLNTTVAVDDIGEAVAAAIGGLACLVAARRATKRNRLAWSLLGASALSWTAGEVVWTVYEVGLGDAVPFPSLADVGFLLAVPLAVAGLLALPLAPARTNTRVHSMVDGAIVALALLFVCWELVLGPVYAAATAGSVSQLIGLAYPFGDVLTATVVIIVATRASGPERVRFLLLLGGLLAIAVADSAFAYLTAAGVYTERGSILDAAWVAGFLLIALAALWPANASDAAEEGPIRSWQAALPGAAFAAAAVSAFAMALNGRALSANLTLLGAVLALLLVVSHLLALADSANLRHLNERAEAMLRRIDMPLPGAPASAFASAANRWIGPDILPGPSGTHQSLSGRLESERRQPVAEPATR